MPKRIGILHYSTPPVIGGVEAVIEAHVKLLNNINFQVTVISGRGNSSAFAQGVEYIQIPIIDSQNKEILQLSSQLEIGVVPENFSELTNKVSNLLKNNIKSFDHLIVHNVLTKHFNLPLTAALLDLLDQGIISNLIAWCHDITWTSPNSRSKVHPGYPWDLLRSYHPNIIYVTVSSERQQSLAELYNCSLDDINVIYNGVDPGEVLGLSQEGLALIDKLKLFDSDLVMLMPVRVTQAKNIEFALRLTAAIKLLGIKPKLVLTGPPDPHDNKSMEYFHSLQEYRNELGLESNMHFIYESGPMPDEPYFIDMSVVGELYRICDMLLMPSHREGFGMPLLEAGLVGLPVFSTDFPAATEIGKPDITTFNEDEDIVKLAMRIIEHQQENPTYRLKKRIRERYTWDAIFAHDILPLIK